MMRAAFILLAACVSLAQAGRLPLPLQDLLSSGSGVHGAVLFSRDEPSLTAFLGDFSSSEDQDSAWLDSEANSDLDGGFQTWLDQQLDMLQALVVPPRSPCGGGRSAYLQQADPSISYMASSRFGPAVLTTVMQQIDDMGADQEDQADDSAWESVFDGEGGEVAWEQPRAAAQQIPDWLTAQQMTKVVQEASDSLPRTLFSSLGALESSSIETGPGAEAGNKLFTDLEAQQQYNAAVGGAQPGAWETPRSRGPPPHAKCGDVMTFAVLAIGCILVWGYLLRSCLTCKRTLQQKHAMCVAEATTNPLLAPLVREDSYSTQDVAVAASEIPQGSYYVPQGSQYVRVAYAPLRSEQ